jgi:hypothetical protein
MTIAETDIFEKVQGMSLTDIPDGLAVSDAAGREVHFLNPVASAVLLLCDGAHDASSIAAILKEEFRLEEAPVQHVVSCLVELEASGVVRKI